MEKVLFITNHYLDKNIGSSRGSRGFITVFSKVFDGITFIYPDYEGSNIKQYIPSNVRGIPCVDHRSKFRKGLDVYRGRPHRYSDFVRKHLLSNQYDIIVIDHSCIWASLTNTFVQSGAKLITIHHNVEKDYVRDNPAPFYLRLPQLFCRVKAEKDATINSDINLTHTRRDKDVLQNLYPQAKGGFYHLGAFDYNVVQYNPSKKTEPCTFITTGVLSFRQSFVPIVDFVEKYWPIVVNEIPQARLIIAGKDPTNEIKEVCSGKPSIELYANPEDMNPLLDKASFYVCPINLGSGQKTRISDGLRKGMPVLCHDVSVNGYETIRDSGYIFPYHDEESFRESLLNMVQTPIDSRDIFNVYYAFFSLESSVKRLKGFLVKEQLLNIEEI